MSGTATANAAMRMAISNSWALRALEELDGKGAVNVTGADAYSAGISVASGAPGSPYRFTISTSAPDA